MQDLPSSRWNKRYAAEVFAYGETPNSYLAQELPKLPFGRILFPAEGEGRNAIYAATLGWQVSAFDLSEEGKKKAAILAEKHQITIDYQVGEFNTLNYLPQQFDAIALIYAHFSAATKSNYHKKLNGYLRPGGTIIFEAFSKKHLQFNSVNPEVGGPKEMEMLFSIAEIEADFANYDIITLTEQEIELQEGIYHNGRGSVIRFVGRKK
jgi:2-polyprenyl-3-methyl-5-hydroxy-6-metoxy-1,4-benzoquinol methylase